MAKKVEVYTPPLQKRIIRFFLDILKYPRKIFRRYAAYNAAIGEMFIETNNDNLKASLNSYRRRNAVLQNAFIILPMVAGVIALVVSIYLNRSEISFYFDRLFAPNYNSGFKFISTIFKRIIYAFTNFPVGFKDLQFFFYGYLGSIFGAWIISKHPAFANEERIVHIFSTLGYIDSEGNPWKVTWTPEAIMITSFNCDPHVLVGRGQFWSSINFPPSAPKVFEGRMNKFIVERRYELPTGLKFELRSTPGGKE